MPEWFKRPIANITRWWGRHEGAKLNLDRPLKLLTVIGTVVVATAILERLFMARDMQPMRDWLKGSSLYGDLFFPDASKIEWKDRLQGVFLLLGLPVAFLLWKWRDRNTRDQIENARKDINLKEFQEVQLRAAGALDEQLPQEAREQLQIAALHQLRGFLRGEYGGSFKRPAFELLLAGHAAAVHRIGVPQMQAQITEQSMELSRAEIVDAANSIRTILSRVDCERMGIIRDEFYHIFHSEFPLESRRFDFLDLMNKAFPLGIVLDGSHFAGAILSGADIDGARLHFAHFEGADLQVASLDQADLFMASLEGANFHTASLKNAAVMGASLNCADLDSAYLQGAFLVSSHLLGASFSAASLEGADLRDVRFSESTNFAKARFDELTIFGELSSESHWDAKDEAKKGAARAPWIARGMINVDAPPPESADG